MSSERENREWINDYLSLKQVNSSNPFTVPDGYFNELEQNVLSLVKLEELKKSAPTEGYAVPENYFEELSSNILSRINIEEAFDKENKDFAVPDGYFENLSQQIQSRIMVEEALSEPVESFTVPEGYFNQLTENILNKTVNQQEAAKPEVIVKKKGIIRQLYSSAAFKYATAACLVLAVGGTILLSQNNSHSSAADDHQNSFLHRSLSAIPVDEIQDYLQQNVDASDTRTLIDNSKQVNADNLSNDLQDELDTTSQ